MLVLTRRLPASGRLLIAILALLAAGLAVPAHAVPDVPAGPPPGSVLVVKGCAAKSDGTLRYPGKKACRPGESTVRFRLAKPVGLCLMPDRSVRTSTKGACVKADGRFRKVPGNQRLFMCAAKKDGAVRWVKTVHGCRTNERRLTLRNHRPFDLTLSGATVPENSDAGTVAGTLGAKDLNAGDAVRFALVAGLGSGDNASFVIEGDRLLTASAFDFEQRALYRVRVEGIDSLGRTRQRPFLIKVTNQSDQAPTGLALTAGVVGENQPSSTAAGTLTATDPDGDPLTYAIVGGAGSTALHVDPTSGALATTKPLNHEQTPTLPLSVSVTDSTGRSATAEVAVTVADGNDAPSGVRISAATVAENQPAGTVVGRLTADDEDAGDAHTFALVPGAADNADFAIVGGALRTANAFDYEADPTYTVRVRATDGAGASVVGDLVITVTNANDAPAAIDLDHTTVEENRPSGTAVGTLSTTDEDAGDTFTYTLVGSGNDNASFSIDGDGLETAASFDYETTSSYTVRVRSTDGAGAFVERDLVIGVLNANEPPVITSLPATISVPENQPIGTAVAGLAASDPESDPVTFSLDPAAVDNALFTISGASLRIASNLDFETKASYVVRVRVADDHGAFTERAVTVTLTDVNEAAGHLDLSPATIAENATGDVGTLSDDDPDAGQTSTYTLVSGTGDADNAHFAIVGDTLRVTSPLDHETTPVARVRVRTSDGVLGYEQALTVSVTDVNEAPTSVGLAPSSVSESAAVGATVGTLTAGDPDAGDSHTFTLVTTAGQSGYGAFTLDGATLETAAALDHETTPTLEITVRATDAGGLTHDQTLTVTVTDVNEAPTTLSLDSSSVAENQVNAVVGNLSATDADGPTPFTYTLVSGNGDDDNAEFSISGAQLSANLLDYEQGATRSVRIRVADGLGASFERAFTITVTDVDEAPTGLALGSSSVAENKPTGTVVGTLSASDPESAILTYTLVSGTGSTDNALFTIVGGELRTAAILDHELAWTRSVRIRAADPGGHFVESAFTIAVTDVNEAATLITLAPSSVDENLASGTTVGTLGNNDPDAGDTATYALVAGTGDADNTSFAIVGQTLRAAASFDRETKSSYSVRVRVTDAGGLPYSQTLTVTVNDVNEAPTDLALSASSIDENKAAGSTVGTLSASDPDAGDTAAFTLVGSGNDNASFTIVGAQLRTAASFDYETKASYIVKVRVTDSGGETYEETLTVTVNDVNDAPVAVADSVTGAIGNTQAKLGSITTAGPTVTLTGALPLANDTDQDGDPLSIVPGTSATTAGGSVTINASGAFVYVPQAGDTSLTDTFTYTVTDGTASATGTVSIGLGSRIVWYVDGAAPTGGDGRSTAPFKTFAPLNGAGDADGSGDDIFVYAGSYGAAGQTSVLTLEQNQTLIGAANGLANGSDVLVAAGGTTTLLADGAATGTLVLADGASVKGVALSSAGTNATTVQAPSVAGASIDAASSIVGGTGATLSITGVLPSSAAIAIAAPVTLGTGQPAIAVAGRRAGSVAFSGAVSSPAGNSGGVSLTDNAGATVSFAGGLTLRTGGNPAYAATAGGTVTVTGAANTLTTTTGTALNIANTTIGAAGVTFRSIDVGAAAAGITLNSTGTSGSLAVTGTGTGLCGGTVADGGGTSTAADSGACTGGRLNGVTGTAVSLVNTQAPALTRMWISGAGDDGIFAKGLTGGATFTSLLVSGNGNGADDNGIDLGDSSAGAGALGAGTVTIDSTTVQSSADINVYAGASAGTQGLSIQRSQIATTTAAGGTRDGVLAESFSGATTTVEVRNSRVSGALGDQIQVSSAGGTIARATVATSTLVGTSSGLGSGVLISAAGSSWTGTMRYDVTGNTVTGATASAVLVSEAGGAPGTFEGYVRNNVIGNAVANSCSSTAHGIELANDTGSGTLVAVVSGNTVQQCAAQGILVVGGDGAAAIHATVANNSVSGLANATSGYAFQANLGITSADTGSFCLAVANNTFASAGTLPDLRIRHRFAPLRIPGYGGGATDTAAVTSYVDGLNPATGDVEVTTPVTGTFTGGADCTQPSF